MTDHTTILRSWLEQHPVVTGIRATLADLSVATPDADGVHTFVLVRDLDFPQPGAVISYGTQFERSLPPEFPDHTVYVDYLRGEDGKFVANKLVVTITKRPIRENPTSTVTATVTVTMSVAAAITRTTTITTDGDLHNAAASAITAAARDATTAVTAIRQQPPGARWGGARTTA